MLLSDGKENFQLLVMAGESIWVHSGIENN